VINGSHVILYSANPDADRAFLRDVLNLPHVDVGRGWLIFGLPPSEVAVHPTDGGERHEMYFMCASIDAFTSEIERRGLNASPVNDQPWGRVTSVTLPGGGTVGVYEPRHARPPMPSASPSRERCIAIYSALLNAWNERNANRFGDLFTPDAVVIGFDGSIMNGRADIVSQMRSIFASHSTAAYVAKIRDVRPLGPGTSMLRAAAGMVPPGGDTLIAKVNAQQSVVFVGDDASLKVALFQNTPAAYHERPDLAEAMTEELMAVHASRRVVVDG
jgi:uncharacterized protein (TIGR02246 family)